jgi:hypothetical protein
MRSWEAEGAEAEAGQPGTYRLARLARTADNTGTTVATVPSGDGHRIIVGSLPPKTGTKSPRSFVRDLRTRVGRRLFAVGPLPRACVTTPSALFGEEVLGDSDAAR